MFVCIRTTLLMEVLHNYTYNYLLPISFFLQTSHIYLHHVQYIFFFDIHYCSVSTNHSGWAPLVDWRYHRKEYSYTRKLLPCLGTWQYCFSWWLNMYLLKLVISAFISFDFILTKCNCQSQIRRWWKSQSCNHPNSWKVIKTIKSVKSTLNQY